MNDDDYDSLVIVDTMIAKRERKKIISNQIESDRSTGGLLSDPFPRTIERIAESGSIDSPLDVNGRALERIVTRSICVV